MKKIFQMVITMFLVFFFISFYGVEAKAIRINNTYDSPPDPPEIMGPTDCSIWKEYEYNFTLSDPDGHRLTELFIVFGDGTNTTLIYKATSSCKKGWRSGTVLSVDHVWKESGNYTIKAKVKNYFFKWSDWGYLDIATTKQRNSVDRKWLNLNLPDIIITLIQRLNMKIHWI